MRTCLVAVAASMALLAPSAHADGLRKCSGIDDTGYKILLDDIVAGETGKPLKALLASRLDANLEQLRTETGLAVHVKRCVDRSPSSPSDFDRDIVQDLNARRVLLEIWGTTAAGSDAGGAAYHDAEIGYALVPVRFYEFDATTPPGAFLVSRRTTSVDSADALIQLVDQAGTLAAYAALGAGAKLLRERAYDEARTQLCKSVLLLKALGTKASHEDTELLRYVQRLAADTVTAARADGTYSGWLRRGTVKDCEGKP